MKHPERVEDYLEHIAEAIDRATGYLQPVPDLEAFQKNTQVQDAVVRNIALQDYDEAIRLKPDSAEVFFNRGLTRSAKGDMGGALQDFSEAIRLKPDFADAFNNRGNVRYYRGEMEGALQDYSEAIRLKPDFAEAFNNRGNARRDKGDAEGASRDYTEAIRLGYKPKE